MIYLDYAATAPVRPEIAVRMHELTREPLGNPSSLHRAGRRARMILEHAREKIASSLGAKVEEIIFCSGATEADNLAILGTLTHGDNRHQHLISSSMEHAAVYETVHRQSQLGRSVSWLKVDEQGLIDLNHLSELLRESPASLVSVMIVNNEVGTRQPVEEVGKLCREHGALFHADGVQDPRTAKKLIESGLVDLVALSGHKMGGLHGGILFVKQGIAVNPQIVGGSQEDGRRAGTSEVLRAESFSMALQATLEESTETILQCRKILDSTLGEIPRAKALVSLPDEQRAAHISSWLFGELAAEPLLVQMDMKGICASSGSACSSHSVEPSRVVRVMGYSEKQAVGLVRFSLGWDSNAEDVQNAAVVVKGIVERMLSKENRRQ